MTLEEDLSVPAKAIDMESLPSEEPLRVLENDKREQSPSEVICVESSNAESPRLGQSEAGSRMDELDAALVLQTEQVSPFQQTHATMRGLAPLREWDWHGCDTENEAKDTRCDTQSSEHSKRNFCRGFPVCRVRIILICIYCVLYIIGVSMFSDCGGQAGHMHGINCTWEIKVLLSFKFPLLSITGVVAIQLVTRLIMFCIALFVWRGSVQRSAIATLGTFWSRKIYIGITIGLIIILYVLSSQAFGEDLKFEFEEVFAAAGLATIITASMGIEEETEFEKVFEQQKIKDGYVYGLAHQYFHYSLSPFLKPSGRRQLMYKQWKDDNPAETLIVLLVEANFLLEEVFQKGEFAQEVSFVKESNGAYLMKLKLAERDNEIAYAKFPVLLNEHLLYIQEWFSSKGRTFVPLDEQCTEYIDNLRSLVKDQLLATDGAIGRVYFVRIPNVPITEIPDILRHALYQKLGEPNTPAFYENTKLVINRQTSTTDTSLHSGDSAVSSAGSSFE